MRKSFSNTVDALGLKIFRNRRVVEQCAGEEWDTKERGWGGQTLEVFGISGAFALFRRTALQQTAFSDGTFFDRWYFMYKEDLDLAYRLRSFGLSSYVLLDAVAYHDRTGAGASELSDWAAARNKKSHSSVVRYYSYCNHLATLYKNEYWQNFILDFPWIAWYEFKKLIYFLLFDRSVPAGLRELRRRLKYYKIEKLNIKSKRKVSWREMRRWWNATSA